jgi:chorismate lyase/3-hydroxybenzoate synthase
VRLHVSLADDLTPPTANHELLLAFHFGAAAPVLHHPALASLRLLPIGHDEMYETWWVEDEVRYSTHGPIRIAESSDYAVLIYDNDESGCDDLCQFVYDAYRQLLAAVDTTAHPRMVKVWNYIGGINEGEGDVERYRQFSVGRAHAFSESGIDDNQSPTATGVGTMQARGLSIIALCSTRDFSLTENPRQVSAFDYPRQYGPKSPKFGRGGSVATADYHLRLFSGTAAIVGHQSMHRGDTLAQLDETLRNLDALCDTLSTATGDAPRLILDDHSMLRVYLRNPADYAAVAERLSSRLGPGPNQVAFLQAEICRRDLTLEIDGVRVQ